MRISGFLLTVAFTGAVLAGAACTDQAADTAKKNVDAAMDATKTGAEKAVDATKVVVNKTAEIAGKAADKTKDVAVATGVAVSDAWITTKLKAKFADETGLKGSDIHVDTTKHLVTLTGTVPSKAAQAKAAEIAGGTEGVARVINQLVVK